MEKTPNLEITIAELMNRWPLTVPVFIKYRMYCVGCSMAIFDTLEEAIDIYRLPREDFLEDLRAAISNIMTKNQPVEKQE
jgi:hybrid cluster-associated redox disulfide protein